MKAWPLVPVLPLSKSGCWDAEVVMNQSSMLRALLPWRVGMVAADTYAVLPLKTQFVPVPESNV